LGFLMEQVSPRFHSEEGLSRDALRVFLADELKSAQWVRIFVSDLDVHLTGGRTAQLTGHFIFGRSRAQSLKELAKQSVMASYQLDLRAEQEEDGQWRFVWAQYRPYDVTRLY
jgi:hypothetical protein